MMLSDSAQHETEVDNYLCTVEFFFIFKKKRNKILVEYFIWIELQIPQGAKNMSEIQEYVRFV